MASGGMDGFLGNDWGFFNLAATVLFCYEHTITFGEEVRCVWQRRVSWASVLFILNRYAMLVASLASIVEVLPWTFVVETTFKAPAPHLVFDDVCSVSVRLVDVCLIVMNVAYAVFAALRVFALYGLNRHMFLFVLLVGLLNPVGQIWLISNEYAASGMYAPYFGSVGDMFISGRINCYHGFNDWAGRLGNGSLMFYFFPALRLHALLFEAILITLTWIKTIFRWKLQSTMVRAPLTTMLLKDGTIYFVSIAVASALNAIGMSLFTISSDPAVLNSIGVWALASSSPVVDMITSICMSRFILGLLAISLDESNSDARTSQWKSIRFAAVAETFARDVGESSEGEVLEGRGSCQNEDDALDSSEHGAGNGVVEIELEPWVSDEY